MTHPNYSLRSFYRQSVHVCAVVLVLLGSWAVAAQSDGPLPTERGDEAIKELRRNGRYDSLMAAVADARKRGRQGDGASTERAVVQSDGKILAGGDFTAIGGQTVIISVASKRFTFAPQILKVSESIGDLDFTPQ